MSESNNFSQERVQELYNELADLRGKFQALAAKHAEAESTIKYYSNPQIYELSPSEGEGGATCQDRLVGDREAVQGSPMRRVAGLRARLYFRKYETA